MWCEPPRALTDSTDLHVGWASRVPRLLRAHVTLDGKDRFLPVSANFLRSQPKMCFYSCGGASSTNVAVFTVSSSSLPKIRSTSRTTFCHFDNLSVCSASQPAQVECECVMRFSSAICLLRYVDLYSASCQRSASRPSRPSVSTITRSAAEVCS